MSAYSAPNLAPVVTISDSFAPAGTQAAAPSMGVALAAAVTMTPSRLTVSG